MGQCGTKIPKEHIPPTATSTKINTQCCIIPTTTRSPQKTSQHTININNDHNISILSNNNLSIFNHINNEQENNTIIHDEVIIDSPMSISTDYEDEYDEYENAEHVKPNKLTRRRRRSSSELMSSSSFRFENTSKNYLTRYNICDQMEQQQQIQHHGQQEPEEQESVDIQNEQLIECTFNRTLFCEDITYEYMMQCNNLTETAPQWITRLTVENMTKFYKQTLEEWMQKSNVLIPTQIPCQFGKVMTPKVFSKLITNVLEHPDILKDAVFGEKAANFLSIPYDIRSIVQYNPDSYIYGKSTNDAQPNLTDFKYFDIICENNEKWNYLCHSTAIYKHDFEYDDCCECYDQPQIACYSYWVRSLHHNKIDFLINCTSNGIFTVIMNDLAFNIADILIKDIGIDENSAWIITDYLPKYLLFNHQDKRCNAKVIYKYDPRDFTQSDAEFYDDLLQEEDDEDDDCFFVHDEDEIIQRHNIDVDDLKSFCTSLRIQHASIPCIPEMSPSVSEYIESITRSADDVPTTETAPIFLSDAAYSANNSSIIHESEQIHHSEQVEVDDAVLYDDDDDGDDDDDDDEKFRMFFTAFIDEEGEDDINMYQWLMSLQKLNFHLTEQQIVAAFRFMLQQNEDNEGYIDFVDFTNFCRTKVIQDEEIKKVQRQIKHFISRNNQ